jgi:hypothetical protein
MRDIGAIARFLLKQGKLVLIVDIPLDLRSPDTHFVGRGLKFPKGARAAKGADYAGSGRLLVGSYRWFAHCPKSDARCRRR